MRIESKDLRAQDRVALQDVIPLPTPYVIYIDPTNICNFRCKFCPTSDEKLLADVGRTKSSLSLADFKSIVNQISHFPQKLKLLSLYKDGEPLLNKDFAEMVRYAKTMDIAERIWTKTNGSLLKPSLNLELIEAGLDMIHISIEHISSLGYKNIADVSINYEQLKSNIGHLYSIRKNCKIYIKIADTALSPAELDKFYCDFEHISDYIAVEKLMGWSYSDIKDFTLGIQSSTYDGLPLISKNICAYPFYVLAVNSDGSVSVCGNDWSQTTSVGNVFISNITDIWAGEELRRLRLDHLNNLRGNYKACKDCYYLQIVPDNLDEYADLIKDKIICNPA